MKKRVVAMALAAAMALSLSACGEEGASTPPESDPAAESSLTTPSETPPQETEPPEELSSELRGIAYCVCNYSFVLFQAREASSEDYELIRSEEGALPFASDVYTNKDEARAASVLLTRHADDFLDNLSFDDLNRKRPEEISYPGGWEPLYEEFQDILADVNAAEAVVDTLEEAFPLVQVSDSDSVIFSENGSEVRFTGFTLEEGRIFVNFHVSNQNLDNKKLYFSLQGAAANYTDLGVGPDTNINEVIAGEELDLSLLVPTNIFQSTLDALGLTVQATPIEVLTFRYKVQVGSDGEQVEKTAELKTAQYQGLTLESFLGAQVGTLSIGNFSANVYAKTTDTGVVAFAVNNVAFDMEKAFYAYVNGKEAKGLNERNVSTISQDGAVQIFFMTAKADDELRREYEIGSSDPLEIAVGWPANEPEGSDPVVIYSK